MESFGFDVDAEVNRTAKNLSENLLLVQPENWEFMLRAEIRFLTIKLLTGKDVKAERN